MGKRSDIHTFHYNYAYLFAEISMIACALCLIFGTGSCSELSSKCSKAEEIESVADALCRSLTFIKDRSEAKTLDVALGVMLVRGNLRWIGDRLPGTTDSRYRFDIGQLLRLCDSVFADIVKAAQQSISTRDRLLSSLLSRHFEAVLAEDLKYNSLHDVAVDLKLPKIKNCSSLASYALKGTPNDSDACIMELLDRSCNLSQRCWFEETNKSENFGYKTSHRLLYLQLAAKCNKRNGFKGVHLSGMRKSLCKQMLKEATALDGNSVFLARDLFLEQIALCGFEGYAEFAKRKWSRAIPRWQSEDGCFGLSPVERAIQKACYNGFADDVNAVIKRDDATLNGYCHTHITAVAISAMAFHLRVLLYEF